MNSEAIKRALYIAFVVLAFLISIQFLFNGIKSSDWHDFDVFYYAAKAALNGESIYIIVGQYHLPFWYFPWTAWLYIPFAIFPHNISLILYQGLSILSAILSVNYLSSYYNPDFKFLDRVLILSLIVPMSLEMLIVGQMEYILLGLIVLTMYAIDHKKDVLAGLIFPFLWTKPHLLIIFTIFGFWRSGKRTVIASGVFTISMLLLESVIKPGWHLEMFALLKTGQQRIDGLEFTTFPSLLGFQENWVGTGNLVFTVALVALAILVVWKFRSLPTVPLLSLALTASVFCAPRAYAYDLPLLIPTMIWLTAKAFRSNLWVWITAAVFPLLVGFTSTTYLLVLFIFLLNIWQAHKDVSQIDNGLTNASTPDFA